MTQLLYHVLEVVEAITATETAAGTVTTVVSLPDRSPLVVSGDITNRAVINTCLSKLIDGRNARHHAANISISIKTR